MDLELVLLLLYAVAFGALFMLREPAWLAGGGLLAFLAVIGHFALGRNATGDAGMGVFIFGVVAAVGFASGAAARATLLALRWGDSRRHTAAVGLLFLCGVPLTLQLWGYVQQREAQRRYAPPSMACKSRLHQARMGDRTLRLPMLWGMTAHTERDLSGQISFYQQEQAREFCEAAERGEARLTMVRIDFPQLHEQPNPLQPVCMTRRAEAWWEPLCRYQRPEQFDLYSIALVDTKRFATERFLSISPPAAGPGTQAFGTGWSRDGPFMRIGSGYRVYFRAPRRPGAASPYLAHCYEDRNDAVRPDGLRCKAAYRLSPEVGVVYDFRIDGEEFAAEALRQDKRVFAIANSLIADGKVPAAR